MRIALQVGSGMQDISATLLKKWGGGEVILSPRDQDSKQLKSFTKRIKPIPGVRLLFDPQCYYSNSTHKKLTKHTHFPNSFDTSKFWNGPGLKDTLSKLETINDNIGTSEFITPSEIIKNSGILWRSRTSKTIAVARKMTSRPPIRLTVAVSHRILEDTTKTKSLRNLLRDFLKEENISRVYLLLESPDSDYFVISNEWLLNSLLIISTLKISGIDVLIGYSNQQSLIYATAGADSIGIGKWANQRQFSESRFIHQPPSKKRSTEWLYATHSLSEVKKRELTRLFKLKLHAPVKIATKMTSPAISQVFSAKDAVTYLKQREAVLHYFRSIKSQAGSIPNGSYSTAKKAVDKIVSESAKHQKAFSTGKVHAETRCFLPALGATKSALSEFDTRLGPLLGRKWR